MGQKTARRGPLYLWKSGTLRHHIAPNTKPNGHQNGHSATPIRTSNLLKSVFC